MKNAANPEFGVPPVGGTVYLSTADEAGMMVSFIQSNYLGFGSGVVIPGTGISLQGRAMGFNLKPGHANQIAGSKRPFHTIIPAFLTRDGQPVMSFGVMGASMQPQGHAQMVLRICDYGLNPQTASDAPRWCVLENHQIALEAGFDDALRTDLRARGHDLAPLDENTQFETGGAQLIQKTDAGYVGGSDHRKDGLALAY